MKMKKLIGIVTALLFVVVAYANEKNEFKKVANASEAEAVLIEFNENWTIEGQLTLEDYMIKELEKMGLENVESVKVYTKDDESIAVYVTEDGDVFTRATSACNGTQTIKCNCNQHGNALWDFNGDGFCDWQTECIQACSGPGHNED